MINLSKSDNLFIGLVKCSPNSDVGNVPDCRSRGTMSIPHLSHTFVEIDHETISIAIPLPSADSRRVVASHKRKYVNKVLVNC